MTEVGRQAGSVAGTAGVWFDTDALPGTAEEAVRQGIQRELSGGTTTSVGTGVTIPHLAAVAVRTVDGDDSHSTLSLWSPPRRRPRRPGSWSPRGSTSTDRRDRIGAAAPAPV